MWDDEDDNYEDLIGPPPPWFHVLRKDQQVWRESEILKGRDPDPYLEKTLIEKGLWKANPA